MTGSPSSTLREAGTSRQPRRRLGRRLSATHVLIAVVVILAFVLNLLVLQDRGSTTLVAVIDEPVAAGTVLDPSTLRMVPIDASFDGVAHLVTESNLENFEGYVFTRSVGVGSPIIIDTLGSPGAVDGLRTMSLPVSVEHAAGGSLTDGDTVDVVSVGDSGANFVATGLEVVGISDNSRGAIGSTGGYHVVVAVDPGEALALAEALDVGSIEIVKATGASPVDQQGTDAP